MGELTTLMVRMGDIGVLVRGTPKLHVPIAFPLLLILHESAMISKKLISQETKPGISRLVPVRVSLPFPFRTGFE